MTPNLPGSRLWRGSRARVGEQLADLGYATGWRMVRAMPDTLARRTFDTGAWYASRGGGPEQLRKNLARVIGVAPSDVPDSLMRDALASYARYWREAFRLPSMDDEMLYTRLDQGTVGRENLDAALEAGRGAVLALPHSANWDMAGVWLVHYSGTFATVAERLKPESLYRRFITYRESLGFEVLPLSGGPRPPYEVLVERLRENRVICLMSDRDLTRTGVQVDLFGEPTRMPAGPARLAIETGAALLPICPTYEGDDWGLDFFPPLDVTSGDIGVITQALADRFATCIAARPQDWHMLQPQWVADLPAERRVRLRDNP